ncbi:hypothetical protein JST97_00990 [bacterium]|nr:hypothetical protein [bacterium]
MNRLLGWVAWLGTLRKQAIPPHILLLVVCLSGFSWGLGNYLEARLNGGRAEVLPQRQLLEQGAPQSFIEITGTVLADGQVSGPDHTIFLPLLDEAEKIVTYVRLPESGERPKAGVTYRLNGMIGFVSPELESKIPQDQAGMRFNRNQYLYFGQRPADARWAAAAMLISLLASWPLLVTWFGHYIVFQTRASTHAAAQQLGKIRASGRFYKGKKERQRFLEAPAELSPVDQGWELKLEEGWTAHFAGPENIRAGSLYLGPQERPALRFEALEKTRQKRQSFVLTFEGPAELQLALERLTSSSEKP